MKGTIIVYHKFISWLNRVYMFSGKVFLAVFNLLCSSIIIGVNIFVSFNHTLDLFSTVDWIGNIGLGATIGCELAFIQSSVNMMVCSLLGRRPSFPIVFVFTLGTGLVMWSNIASTLDSPSSWIVCVLLGLVPPLMMWGSKGVLADSMMMKQTPEAEQTEQPNEDKQEALSEQQTETNTQPITIEHTHESIIESNNESINKHTTENIEQENEQTQETNTESSEQTEDQTDSEPTEQTDIKQTPNEHQTNEQTKKRTKYTVEQIEQIEQTAIQFMNEHDKLPSIRELAQLSNCTPYIANKALRAIKETEQIKQTA